MKRVETLARIQPTSDLMVTPEMDECFIYKNNQVCMKDLVKLEDLEPKLQTQQLIQTQDPTVVGGAKDWTMPSVADQGCCSAANPYVPMTVAPIVLICDIFFPGVGTIIAAYYDPTGCNCKTITCGIFQMLLTIVIVGWVWSIV